MTEQIKNDLISPQDIGYWCEELNVRAEELAEIIKKVGPSVHEVRVYLAKMLLLNWPKAY